LNYSHASTKAISPRGSGPRVKIGVEPPHCGSLDGASLFAKAQAIELAG
jgi:hypothetical protein